MSVIQGERLTGLEPDPKSSYLREQLSLIYAGFLGSCSLLDLKRTSVLDWEGAHVKRLRDSAKEDEAANFTSLRFAKWCEESIDQPHGSMTHVPADSEFYQGVNDKLRKHLRILFQEKNGIGIEIPDIDWQNPQKYLPDENNTPMSEQFGYVPKSHNSGFVVASCSYVVDSNKDICGISYEFNPLD